MNLEKYKQLYEYARDVHQEELRRFDLITQKATHYLSVLSVLLGLGTIFGRWLISDLLPPTSLVAGAILLFSFLLYLSLLFAWAMNFQILRGGPLEKMPLNDDVLRFFDDYSLVDIYSAYSRRLKEAYQNNLVQTNKRAKLMLWGHRAIVVSVGFIVVLSFLAVYYNGSRNKPDLGKETTMTEKDQGALTPDPSNPVQPSKPAFQEQQPGTQPIAENDPKPNPNVVAPAFDIVTHGEFNLGQQKVIDSTKMNKAGSNTFKPDSQSKK